jgi:hypothetical protein
MSDNSVLVTELTAKQALMIYRRLGPDLRLMIQPPLNLHKTIGWAFLPENSDHLLNAIRRFLHRAGLYKVVVHENDFDFNYEINFVNIDPDFL